MNEMTDAQINVAVAECCGWRKVAPWALDSKRLRGYPPDDNGRDFVPNFTESRDAMAGALEKLSGEEWVEFCDKLADEVLLCSFPKFWNEVRELMLATPKHQSIAFLKAKGKL